MEPGKKKEINKHKDNKQKERNKQINNTATCSRGGEVPTEHNVQRNPWYWYFFCPENGWTKTG
jgi:hypothetical protein